MRSASLLPSTPAGLRGSERSTVLFLVGLFGGSVVCLGVCFGAVRCVPLSPFRSGLVGRGARVGVGPVPFQTSFFTTPEIRGPMPRGGRSLVGNIYSHHESSHSTKRAAPLVRGKD